MRALSQLSVAAVVLTTALGATTHAADQTILGSRLVVKNPSTPDKRKVLGKAKEVRSPNTLVGDPVTNGASLTITVNGDTASQQTYALPAGTSALTGRSFWSGDTIKGFTYKDAKGENGPAKTVQIKQAASGIFQIKAVIDGKRGPVSVVPPNPGTDGCLRLAMSGHDAYSVRFGAEGKVTDGGATLFKVVHPLTEGTCPSRDSAQRFVDNGDGTVTDHDTGLQWEKKDGADGVYDFANPHDVDNLYSWSMFPAGTAPDGTVFTDFLRRLNTCTSTGGAIATAAFGGHCDWRLPTITELQTILLAPYPCGTSPCIDPVFGPTGAFDYFYWYWSSTTFAGVPPFGGDPAAFAWGVSFEGGGVSFTCKDLLFCDFVGFGGFPVRAVRGP